MQEGNKGSASCYPVNLLTEAPLSPALRVLIHCPGTQTQHLHLPPDPSLPRCVKAPLVGYGHCTLVSMKRVGDTDNTQSVPLKRAEGC